MEMVELVMTPVRQRIFQYLLVHETGTTKEIRKALPDIPSASVYRHMKLLADHGVLMVVGENRIRGTVESIYKLDQESLTVSDESGRAAQTGLLALCGAFAKYFAGESPNPERDMLLLSNCTLTLTDEDFGSFLSEINEVALKYMSIGVAPESKTRKITLISSPVDV